MLRFYSFLSLGIVQHCVIRYLSTSSKTATTANPEVSPVEQNTLETVMSDARLDAAKTMLTLNTESLPEVQTASVDHVETQCAPSPILELSGYPWKRKLSLCIERLTDVDIDIWCGNTKNYHQYKCHTKPKKQKTSSTKHSAEPTMDQLLSRAKSLINQSKEWIKTSVKIKEETVAKGVLVAEATGTLVNLETDSKKQALASLHAVTIAQLSAPSKDVLPVGTKSKPNIKDTPDQRTRKISCNMCSKSFDSVKSLNDHHRSDHGIVTCDICGKSFATRSALDKHMYVHRQMDFLCVTCGKQFAFQSRLEQHKLVHQPQGSLKCTVKRCKKTFRGVGDLNRHIKSHNEDVWFPCDFCSYKNKDKQNTMSHMRVHSNPEDGRFVCSKCSKIMWYSTQFLRHKETGCNL